MYIGNTRFEIQTATSTVCCNNDSQVRLSGVPTLERPDLVNKTLLTMSRVVQDLQLEAPLSSAYLNGSIEP